MSSLPVSSGTPSSVYRAARKCASACSAQPDSWLSASDANLLLRKQTSLAIHEKNFARAVDLLDRLIAYEPKNAEHYANRGLMHYSLGNTEQALADYDQALLINPDLDRAYSNRANLYATQQNWTAAIADYDCALDLNPLNIRARINQAITFREMGEYEEALACLDIAHFFTFSSATLHAERGRTYHLQGEWNCAIAEYHKALSLSGGAEQVDAVASRGDFTQAQVLRQRVLKWMSSFE